MIIRRLKTKDFEAGFFETLAALTEVNLTVEQAIAIKKIRTTRTYVALINKQVVGTASLVIDNKFIHSGGITGYIEDVAVNNQCQHKGVGSKLINHLVKVAKELGCYKVMLSCDNKVKSFYEKLGFCEHNLNMRLNLK